MARNYFVKTGKTQPNLIPNTLNVNLAGSNYKMKSNTYHFFHISLTITIKDKIFLSFTKSVKICANIPSKNMN